MTFYNNAIIKQLIELNIIEDKDDPELYCIIDDCGKIQRHSCSSCNNRCRVRKGEGDDDVQCRNRDYFEISVHPSKYMYFACNANHSKEAIEVLEKCDLLKKNDRGKIVELHPKLKAGVYTYPAEPNEKLSPFCPVLFAWTRCSSNIQICDTYLCSRYLAKYVQGLDENLKVELKNVNTREKVVLEEKVVYNTKVSTSGYYEKIRANKNKIGKSKVGRAIGIPEILSLMFQEPQIYTNVDFIHIPTCALEFRTGMELIKPFTTKFPREDFRHLRGYVEENARERNQGLDIPCQDVRKLRNFPKCRLFSKIQEQLMKDILVSPYSLDMITLFSLRPPELCFIKSPKIYLSYFIHGKQIKNCENSSMFVKDNLSNDIFNCMWINGANQQVWVRKEAIIDILLNQGCKGNIRKMFINLQRLCDNKDPLFTDRNVLYDNSNLDDDDSYTIGNIASDSEFDGDDVYCNWQQFDYSGILNCFVYKRSNDSQQSWSSYTCFISNKTLQLYKVFVTYCFVYGRIYL